MLGILNFETEPFNQRYIHRDHSTSCRDCHLLVAYFTWPSVFHNPVPQTFAYTHMCTQKYVPMLSHSWLYCNQDEHYLGGVRSSSAVGCSNNDMNGSVLFTKSMDNLTKPQRREWRGSRFRILNMLDFVFWQNLFHCSMLRPASVRNQ